MPILRILTSFNEALYAWISDFSGSTRILGLLRITLVFVIWGRWAQFVRLSYDPGIVSIFVTCVFFIFSIAMLLGIYSRTSTFLTGLCLAALYYYLPFEAWTAEHHEYLLMISTLFLALTPCHKSFSWDRYREVHLALKNSTPIPPETGDLWALRLIQLQLSAVYFWGVYDKLTFEYLSGLRLQQIYTNNVVGSLWYDVPWFESLMLVAALSSVVLELALAFGLYFPRVRLVLLPMGIAFHVVIYATLDVKSFTALVCALYIAYLDPQRLSDRIDLILGRPIRK